MSNPFRVTGPAVVSFSGGSTSADMLRRILEAYICPICEGDDEAALNLLGADPCPECNGIGHVLPSDVHVLFANTGKEDERTLVFVDECARRWNVPIVWLEYRRDSRERGAASFVEVNFATASRAGEPFEQLISFSGSLPTPRTRFCTTELKVRPMAKWMRSKGYEAWDMVMGIRADEPRRAAKLRRSPPERWEHVMPLVDAGITKADVRAFWATQPFRLQLEEWEGNCDLCFEKSRAKRARILFDAPERAAWWIEQERRTGCVFNRGESVERQLQAVRAQGRLPVLGNDQIEPLGCFCGD